MRLGEALTPSFVDTKGHLPIGTSCQTRFADEFKEYPWHTNHVRPIRVETNHDISWGRDVKLPFIFNFDATFILLYLFKGR
jgi:hypothetical protein